MVTDGDEYVLFSIAVLCGMGVFASCTSRRKLLLLVGSLDGVLALFITYKETPLAEPHVWFLFTLMAMSFIDGSMFCQSTFSNLTNNRLKIDVNLEPLNPEPRTVSGP